LASDYRGIQGLAVAVLTALERSSMSVELWVIQQGLSRSQQLQLRELWERTGKLEALHFVPPPRLPGWWANRHYPLIAWARIQIDLILPRNVSRCIYVDIDVLVGADLAELAATELSGCVLGMVLNTGLAQKDLEYVGSLGLTEDSYYNTGVVLMDLDRWRRERAREGLIARRDSLPVDLWFVDQDLINVYFAGCIASLDKRWNLRDAAAVPEGNVLHFAGRPKPWEVEDFSSALPGLRRWKEALDRSGIDRTEVSTWRRAMDGAAGLRIHGERLVRRYLSNV
jgi:lipopolysaccharide biosynthesis glycosyltransferase